MSLILDGTTGVPVTTVTGTLPVANGGSGVTTSTGSGAVVLGTSPTLTTPTISSLSSAAATGLTLQSAGTTAITVDTSQNVGIGTSSPTTKLTVGSIAAGTIDATYKGNIRIEGTETTLASQGGLEFKMTSDGYGAKIQTLSSGGTNLAFATRNNSATWTERMRIDTSGNLLVNSATSPSGSGNAFFNGIVYVGSTNTDPTFNRVNGLLISTAGTINTRANTTWDMGRDVTSGGHINFYTDNGSARVAAGSISSNGSTTTYATSSDYRMKTDVQPMTNALSKIMQLNPVTYKWVNGLGGTKENGEGFIAHELQEVAPDCVTGEKDAVDAEGNPQYQGIDPSFLVATLTAAIQEAHALIIQLQADVAALKR